MAVVANAYGQVKPTGPHQHGRGVNGQYVYWITHAAPSPESIHNGLRSPKEFDRKRWSEWVVLAHEHCDIEIVETAVFQEPHANGEIHNNCLARCLTPYRWKKVGEYMYEFKVCVTFGENIKTWPAGIVYGRVASEHKGPEMLDPTPYQWAKAGEPTRFEDVIPKKWQAPGFLRRAMMNHMGFLQVVREHAVRSEGEVWALAADLEERGDRALMAYCMDGDVGASLEKALKAVDAKEALRRSRLTKIQIVEEFLEKGTCVCSPPGSCYDLMKDVLVKNGVDGEFQRRVCDGLKYGRLKKRVLCVLGGRNMAKSFLFRPLEKIFKVYMRPDGGSYQLEQLLEKELVFLNDCEYDDDAKKWMGWGDFKNFLEGAPVPVARPKNRGGNVDFKDLCPVFITAPQEISLCRGKKLDRHRGWLNS